MTRRDRGAADVLGLVLLAPAALALAILILWIGRQVDTDAQVQAASSAAAQAAARQRTTAAAVAAARTTVAAMLTDAKSCAGGPSVLIDTSEFRAGGAVTVMVSCSPQRSDLALAEPRAATLTARATASIDTFRSVGLP